MSAAKKSAGARAALTRAAPERAARARAAAAARDGTPAPQIDPLRARHLALARGTLVTDTGARAVMVDDAESPLMWLARRKGRDGRALIAPVQLQAGERLRAAFTRAQLMPRTTSNWTARVVVDGRRGGGTPQTFSDVVIAARQSVQRALAAVGPEFSGLLLDVCCFLKRLDDVERERGWPPRSAKVVLQLGLDRLARHYGLAAAARGRATAPLRAWHAAEREEAEE